MSKLDKNEVVKKYVNGQEEALVEAYIKDGPSSIKEKMDLDDHVFEIVFDHLVFEHNLIYKAIISNHDFFADKYVRYGSAHIRDILDITDEKFDLIYEIVFDFLVANEAVYYHVLQHRERYTTAFKARGKDFVRKVLGLWKPKYEESWQKIYEFLLNCLSDCIFSEKTLDQGIEAFSMIVNGSREQRIITQSGLLF